MPTFKDLMDLAGKTKAKILTRLRIDEVSSVDRGAGEGVKITLMKRSDDDKSQKRKSAMNYDERVSKFFTNIFSNKAPDDINKAIAALAKSVASIEASDPKERASLLAKTFEQFTTYVNKLSVTPTDKPNNNDKGDNIMPLSADVIKALGLKEDASEADVLKAIEENNKTLAAAKEAIEKAKAKFTDDEEKEDEDEKDEEKKKAFRAMSHDQRTEYMKKKHSTELPQYLQDIMKQAAVDRAEVQKLKDERELIEIRKVCADAGIAEGEAETIQKASRGGDKEAVSKLVAMIKAANAQAKAAGVWKELGSNRNDNVGTTALEQLNALAAELKKKQPELSLDQAFAKVYQDPANVKLAQRERLENSPRAA